MRELDPAPDGEAHGSLLVSHVFLNYLQLSGLYPLTTDKNGGRQKCSVQWCWVVAFAVSVLSLINFADYTMAFLEEIESMEFFELISYFARADVTLQTAAIFLVFLLNRNQVYHLVFTMTALLKGMLPEKQLNRIRRTSCVLAFGWIGWWQCMHLIGYVAYIWDDVRCWECLIRPTYFLSKSNNMPTYLDYLITGSSKLLDTNTELTAQCFYFMLVYWMGTAYQDIQQRLERALQAGDVNAQMDMVKEAERLYLRLRTVTNKFNDCFGTIGLLIYLRDAFSFMTVTSLALRVLPLREPNQSLEDYQANINLNEGRAKHDTIVGCIGIANAMVQTILCLRCHSKVQVIRKTLQELAATARSSRMQVEYQEMSGSIDSTSGAISAGALFITKESIASAVGLFAGYAVLIYETRDSIVGDQQSAKKKDLPQLADLIIDFLREKNVSKFF